MSAGGGAQPSSTAHSRSKRKQGAASHSERSKMPWPPSAQSRGAFTVVGAQRTTQLDDFLPRPSLHMPGAKSLITLADHDAAVLLRLTRGGRLARALRVGGRGAQHPVAGGQRVQVGQHAGAFGQVSSALRHQADAAGGAVLSHTPNRTSSAASRLPADGGVTPVSCTAPAKLPCFISRTKKDRFENALMAVDSVDEGNNEASHVTWCH